MSLTNRDEANSSPVILDSTMTSLRDRSQQTIRAVVFDVGGVLIDLHSDEARRELIERYGLLSQGFARLTRSSFESHPRSITELAMIGKVGTSAYLEARSEERRVGKECRMPCRSRWSPDH